MLVWKRKMYLCGFFFFYLLKKELLEWEKLEVFLFSSSRRNYIYLFVWINGHKTEDGSKFSGTDRFLLLAMIMASYLFLFVTVIQLNDLVTNICCNSETCLPTNKLLIEIYHLAMTNVLVVLSRSWNTFLWNRSEGPPKDGTWIFFDFFFFLIFSLICISPLSVSVPNDFWPSNSGCALYALVCFIIEAVIS